MVIAVLERRREIGLRRALGPTRRHIRIQFVMEAALLASLGGVTGLTLGAAITTVCAGSRNWPVALSPGALVAGLGLAIAIGALAGLYPATRAARLPPRRPCARDLTPSRSRVQALHGACEPR